MTWFQPAHSSAFSHHVLTFIRYSSSCISDSSLHELPHSCLSHEASVLKLTFQRKKLHSFPPRTSDVKKASFLHCPIAFFGWCHAFGSILFLETHPSAEPSWYLCVPYLPQFFCSPHDAHHLVLTRQLDQPSSPLPPPPSPAPPNGTSFETWALGLTDPPRGGGERGALLHVVSVCVKASPAGGFGVSEGVSIEKLVVPENVDNKVNNLHMKKQRVQNKTWTKTGLKIG